MRVILWVCVILLLQVPGTWGKIYKWTDDSGQVHFTDNPATIPTAYRHQTETQHEKGAATGDVTPTQPLLQPNALPKSVRVRRPSRSFVVPLKRAGNAFFAEATFNGFARVPLMVDTGAALTVIATKTAHRLGLNLDHAAMIPMRSASGVFLAHLTKVRSMKVGNAIIKDVEVVVHDIAPGREQGLLGMSFLDYFNVTIHTLQDVMNLKPLDQVAGATLYGGKPQSWWQSKFRFYRRQMALIDTYLATRNLPQLEQSRRYFRSELAALERRARLASVPRAWRY